MERARRLLPKRDRGGRKTEKSGVFRKKMILGRNRKLQGFQKALRATQDDFLRGLVSKNFFFKKDLDP